MFIGVLRLELFIQASQSLKEKRFIVKSVKDRIRNKFNVSIAEVDHLDKWQLAGLGIALVTNERRLIDSSFEEIRKSIEFRGDVEITSQQMEVY